MKQIEELRAMSREERMKYLEENRSELMETALETVNGGSADVENPNSEGIYKGNYYTSWGYVCAGSLHC